MSQEFFDPELFADFIAEAKEHLETIEPNLLELEKAPDNQQRFNELLDQTLREVNSDYDAKRQKDIALQAPIIHAVPPGTFLNWLRHKGKLGGQNKVPRLSNSREYVDEILQVVNS